MSLATVIFTVSLAVCSAAALPSPVWKTLINETSRLPKDFVVGSWDPTFWTGPSSPGTPADFMAWGLKLKTAHPEFYATINVKGELVKPGYIDEKHRGKYSIDYPILLRVTKKIADLKLMPTIGLFIHNFETVSETGLMNFFKRYSQDLKYNNISSVILVVAWDIQGEWPAWEDGATRDCHIDPGVFSKQMRMIRNARDKSGAKNIVLGVALASGFEDHNLNKNGDAGNAYVEGLRACDIIGMNVYPTKVAGPRAAFVDASKLWAAVGGNKPFAFFEYSIGDYDYVNKKPIIWSDNEKADFVKETYGLLSDYSFVKQIHWWFIGKGDGARIKYE